MRAGRVGVARPVAQLLIALVIAATGLVGVLASGSLLPSGGSNVANYFAPQSASAFDCGTPLSLTNGGFEAPVIPPVSFQQSSPAATGWSTTDSQNEIEIWSTGFLGVPSFSGNQFAEINANSNGTLYQDLNTSSVQGQTLTWAFAHRARQGTDVMSLLIGAPAGPVSQGNFSATTAAWVFHQGTYTVPIGQTVTRFAYQAISTGSGNQAVGNFLDVVAFGLPVCTTDLSIEKTVVGGATSAVLGSTVNYQIVVTNTGAVADMYDAIGATVTDTFSSVFSSVNWTCSGTGSATCAAAGTGDINDTVNIPEGESLTYLVSAVIDPLAAPGIVANTAAVAAPATSGGQPFVDSDSTNNSDIVSFQIGEPEVTLTKSATYPDPLIVGSVINYQFAVENTGDLPVENVTITDPLPGLTAITPPSVATLAPGATANFTSTLVVTQAHLDAGSIENAATATADVTGCPGCESLTSDEFENIDIVQTSAISIDKTSDVTPGEFLVPGDTITYTFTVDNIGNVTLTNVVVTDPLPGLTAITPSSIASLAPSDPPAVFTASKTVTAADIANGGITNTASVDSVLPPSCQGCQPATDSDELVTTIQAVPTLTIEKTSNILPADPVSLGETITYSFLVSNTGNVPFTDVMVTDLQPGLTWAIGPNLGTLLPGENATATATRVVTEDSIRAGEIVNSAAANGNCGVGCSIVPPTDSVTIDTDPVDSSLDLVKSSDVPTGETVNTDDVITYTFELENTGNVTLENVTISDPMPGLSWVTGPTVGTLAPGETATLSATYVVSEDDIRSGGVENTATALADCGVGCTFVPPTDSVDIDTDPVDAGLTLVKTSDVPDGETVAPGDTITYTFLVTNIGNVTVDNVSIADVLPGLTWVNGPDLGSIPPGLAQPGMATYVVTEDDIRIGTVENSATATGSCGDNCDVDPGTDGLIIPTDPFDPQLSITKSSDVPDGTTVGAGDTIIYTFLVENTGNITIENASVSDVLSGLVWVTGPNLGTIAPGASATATATYVVTEADLFAGGVTNVATVTGNCGADCEIVPPTDEITVPTDPVGPALTIDKTSDLEGNLVIGDVITYSFLVTNTGNVTINNVTVADALPELVWVNGPDLGSLAPGASAVATATYTVTGADITAGGVHNSATASGDCGVGCLLTLPVDEVDVPAADPGSTGLSIEKTADITEVVHPGDLITYTFTVTNNGDSTVTNVTVTDLLPGLSAIDGPQGSSLAPGESAVFTATYPVTALDADANQVSNTASVSGIDGYGTTIGGEDSLQISACSLPMTPEVTPTPGPGTPEAIIGESDVQAAAECPGPPDPEPTKQPSNPGGPVIQLPSTGQTGGDSAMTSTAFMVLAALGLLATAIGTTAVRRNRQK